MADSQTSTKNGLPVEAARFVATLVAGDFWYVESGAELPPLPAGYVYRVTARRHPEPGGYAARSQDPR